MTSFLKVILKFPLLIFKLTMICWAIITIIYDDLSEAICGDKSQERE